MNLHYYEHFYEVAKAGNMTKAAEALYITQPALSKSISNLEEYLGYQLFIRTPKGVELTREGRILYESVNEVYDILQEATDKIINMRQENANVVRVASVDDLFYFFLIPHLQVFYNKYPNITINAMMEGSGKIIEYILENKCDFGLVNRNTQHPELKYTRLMDINMAFVVGEKYKFLADTSPHSIQDIKDYPFLMLSEKGHMRELFDRFARKHKVNIVPRFVTANLLLLSKLAQENFGIALIPENLAQPYVDKGELFYVTLKENFKGRPTYLVRPKNLCPNPHVRLLINQICDMGDKIFSP